MKRRTGPRQRGGHFHRLAATAIVAAAFAPMIHAEEVESARRGTLTGRFVYAGEPSPPRKLVRRRGIPIPDESLLVNEHNYGIANVVVVLVSKGLEEPARRDDEQHRVDIVAQNDRFVPRVALAQASQVVRLTNRMPNGVNAQFSLVNNVPRNPLLKAGAHYEFQLKRAERLPTQLSASIQPWMMGHLVVTDHPFAVVSDADGVFRMDDIPPGKWTFRFWHERVGYIQRGEQDDESQIWPKGRVEIVIEPGRRPLGEIRLPPTLFK